MIGKASRSSTILGGRGRSHSVSPTSNTSAKSRPLGEVNRFAALTLSYPPQPSPSTAWVPPSTTWLLRRLTTPQSSSSSRQLTWHSPLQKSRSLRPTRSSRRLWLKSQELPRPALLGYHERSTNLNLVTTLDAWPPYQRTSHQCNMRLQGSRAHGRGDGFQYDGR